MSSETASHLRCPPWIFSETEVGCLEWLQNGEQVENTTTSLCLFSLKSLYRHLSTVSSLLTLDKLIGDNTGILGPFRGWKDR